MTKLSQEIMRGLQAEADDKRGKPGTVEVILYVTIKNYGFSSMGSALIQYENLATLASASSKREIEKAGDRIIHEQILPDFGRQHPKITCVKTDLGYVLEIKIFPQN